MILSTCCAEWKMLLGYFSGLSGVRKRRGEGLCVSCERGASPLKRIGNTRDLGSNWSVP